MTEKIRALIDDPQRRHRLGVDARERVHDGLMWPQQAPVLLEALSTALDLPSRNGNRP